MIKKETKIRIARPTDNLAEITRMYTEGLGFKLIGQFDGHNGFDGSLIGHPMHMYHLEFTHHHGSRVGKAPTKDHLLVFYIADQSEWKKACQRIEKAGFIPVVPYNSYWDEAGKTFEDMDGYRVVLQNRDWTA